MKKGIDTSAMVQAALNKGLTVTVVEAGKVSIDPKVFKMNRGDRLDVALKANKGLHGHVIDHMGREWALNEHGEQVFLG